MRISLGLPTDRVDRAAEFVTGEAIAEMSRGAEAAGFDAVYVTEHPIPERQWKDSGGHHALDPFVALSFAAAATTTLRLQTHLCVLPYRNPFITAKAVASLDALSGGRLILGVGAGYLKGEFEALGVDFSERNELTDEAIVIMKQTWGGQPVTVTGRHFRAESNVALPVPAQPPGPPIWVGGNSKRAIRRAVELADGWVPMPNAVATVARRRSPALETLADLRRGIDYASELSAQLGRSAPFDVASSVSGLQMALESTADDDRLVEGAMQLADAGVTYLYASATPSQSRAEFLDQVARMAETWVPRITAIPVTQR
jgi:probable F420-dependent oxidoreductase